MDILTIFIGLATIIGTLLGKLIISEAQDWMPTLARRLVDRAVSLLPEDQRDRYREEWYAHIDDCPGRLGKFWHAFDCMRGAATIVREFDSEKSQSARYNQKKVQDNDHKKNEDLQVVLDYDALIEEAARLHDRGHEDFVYYLDDCLVTDDLIRVHGDLKRSNLLGAATPAWRRRDPRSPNRPI